MLTLQLLRSHLAVGAASFGKQALLGLVVFHGDLPLQNAFFWCLRTSSAFVLFESSPPRRQMRNPSINMVFSSCFGPFLEQQNLLRLFCGWRIQALEILEGYIEKTVVQVGTPQGSVRAVPYFMNGSNDGSEHVGIQPADVTKLKRFQAPWKTRVKFRVIFDSHSLQKTKQDARL